MRKKLGFTLVEIGIVLLIIVTIIFAIIKLVGDKKDESFGTEEAQALIKMIQTIQKTNLSALNISGNNSIEYINFNVLPTSWKANAGNVTHAFGGNVGFAATAEESHLNMQEINNKSACVALASTLAQSTQISSLWVGNPVVQLKPNAGTLNYSALVTACGQTPGVRVAFNYYKINR